MTARLLKLFVASLVVTPLLAVAAVPATINFSARIADNGRPVTGSQTFTFKLWTVETGGTVGTDDVWTEGPRSVTVTDGVVSTALGDPANSAPPLAPVLTGVDLFLEVTMGSTTFPRFKLQSVPYALVAGTVVNLGASSGTTGFVDMPTTFTYYQVASVSVTFPSAGFAYVTFGSEPYLCGGSINLYRVRRDGTATLRTGYFETTSTTTGYPHPMSRSFVTPVTAGAHTFTGELYSGGVCSAYNSEISVVFVPNSL